MEILCGDALEVTAEHVGPCDRIWDRAALVALPAEVRPRYVRALRDACPASTVLLSSFTYPQDQMGGPPFSVPEDEVRSLWAGARVALLEDRDMLDDLPRFRERGLTAFSVQTWAIEL